jgi:hypothetical protein
MTTIGALASDAPEPSTLARSRIRRCQYRRVVCVDAATVAYEVHCLHPHLRVAHPIGDLAVAQDVCNACDADGIFRPDED